MKSLLEASLSAKARTVTEMRNICASTRARWLKSSTRSTFMSVVVWNHNIHSNTNTTLVSSAPDHEALAENVFESTIVAATNTRS